MKGDYARPLIVVRRDVWLAGGNVAVALTAGFLPDPESADPKGSHDVCDRFDPLSSNAK